MSFIKITPEQIMHYWNYLRDCIEEALPPYIKNNPESFIKIQENLLIGKMECFIGIEGSQTYAVAITQVVFDECTNTKNLLLFSLNVIQEKNKEIWVEGLEFLKRYAKGKGCFKLIAYSLNPNAIGIAAKLGGDVETRILMFDV